MSTLKPTIDLYAKVKAFISQRELLKPGDKVLVATSGGVDSVVLLYLMKKLADEWRLELAAGHVNHRLRGAEANEDERFVRRLCLQWQVTLYVRRADVARYGREHKLGTEAAARAVRYALLSQWAARYGYQKIAMGHTADDQVETVLMQFLRGAGVAGLRGMPCERENIIRPLLPFDRARIEAYAQRHHLSWRHDSSNDDVQFTRNRIRHQLLPLLQREYNPQLAANLLRLADTMRETHGYLEHLAEQALQKCLLQYDSEKIILEINTFLSYFKILQKYIVRLVIRRLGGDERMSDDDSWTAFAQFIRAARPKSPLRRRDGWEIWRWQNQLVFLHRQNDEQRFVLDRGPGTYQLAHGHRFEIKKSSATLQTIRMNRDAAIAYIDAEPVKWPLTLRKLQAGDRFWPLGLGHEKSVATFLKDARLANYRRHKALILESGDKIVWLCGHRLDDRFKVTQKTESIYQLKLIKHVGP